MFICDCGSVCWSLRGFPVDIETPHPGKRMEYYIGDIYQEVKCINKSCEKVYFLKRTFSFVKVEDGWEHRLKYILADTEMIAPMAKQRRYMAQRKWQVKVRDERRAKLEREIRRDFTKRLEEKEKEKEAEKQAKILRDKTINTAENKVLNSKYGYVRMKNVVNDKVETTLIKPDKRKRKYE